MLVFGHRTWFSTPGGTPGDPPHNEMAWAGVPEDEIEKPNPVPGTNNFWIQDGYGGCGTLGNWMGVYGGGSYTNCSDASRPGVAPILNYLSSLPRRIEPKVPESAVSILDPEVVGAG